jgi:tetratricopeptide (TPR) repeat protein
MYFALAISLWLGAPNPVVQQPAPPSSARADAQADQLPASYYFLLGRYLEGEGKLPEAIDALKHAIELEPKTAELRAELAAFYARQDRAQDAIAAAEDALKIDPKNREANRVLGSVLASLTDRRQTGRSASQIEADQTRAIAALEIARAGGAPDLSLDLMLARLYLARDRPADAVPLLRRIVDEQPQFGDGWVLLASALEAAGQVDDAASTLNELLTDQPTMFRARVQLAELYEHQRRWLQADAQSPQRRNRRSPRVRAPECRPCQGSARCRHRGDEGVAEGSPSLLHPRAGAATGR